MRVKDGDARRAGPAGLPVLLALLLGSGLGYALAGGGDDGARGTSPAPAAVPGPQRPAQPDLPTLELAMTPADLGRLQAIRDHALQTGILSQPEGQETTVAVQVSLDGQTARGTARLKGDWLDHVDTDKWSLRLELDAPIQGMRRFSVQHPKTRGLVLEWLCLEVGRREGLLTPRTAFWNVTINGVGKGLYLAEEHFGKELLESQGRRDGPIVRFTEDDLWQTWLQYDFQATGRVPGAVLRATSVFTAAVAGYGERRLARVTELNQRLHRAIEQLHDLRRTMVTDLAAVPVLRAQALTELQGRSLDDVFVPEQVGRMLAVYSLFRAYHGLAWHQLRFYHDPVRDRLEPILFDTGANFFTDEGELLVTSSRAAPLTRSARVYEAAFRALGRIASPEYLAALERDLRPRLATPVAAMTAEGMLPPGVDLAALFDKWLPDQAAFLRRVTHPEAAVNCTAVAMPVRTADGERITALEVEAWATTEVPVYLRAFRFGNGREIGAAAALLGLCGADPADSNREDYLRPGGLVRLPLHGARLCFRFPLDARLLELHTARAVRQAIRQQLQPDANVDVDVQVRYQLVAGGSERSLPLDLRHREGPVMGRPAPPTPTQCLAQHPFLRREEGREEFVAPPGVHAVQGDLLLPEGSTLRIEAGATLRFPKGGVLVCSRLLAEGTQQQTIVLEPADRAAGWAGLLVLDGAETSVLRQVMVRGTTSLQRGAWQSPGGVTFYRSPVEIESCEFRDSRGEDAVNVYGARLLLRDTVMQDSASDLLDCDFVTGLVEGCSFANSGGDALDLSGSDFTVRRCRFSAIGDKALSVGEGTRLGASECVVESAAIAVAAKDRATVELVDFRVLAVQYFVLAAYVKKPEYGPATIAARDLQMPPGGVHLCQTGSSIDLDGRLLPAQDVDVEELYRRKVLGN